MREFLSTGTGIVGLILSILGGVFTAVGAALTATLWPFPIGIIFLAVGGPIAITGFVLVSLRLAAVRQRARLLREGLQARGTILTLAQNVGVRLNGQHPWVVRYRYEVNGQEHEGRESMMDLPDGYHLGATVTVMYDPARTGLSTLERG
jgi:Protein of unknown function (DUF3592)